MSNRDNWPGCSYAGDRDSSEELRKEEAFGGDAAGRLLRSFSLFRKKDWDQITISGYTAGEIKILMTLKYKERSEGAQGFEARSKDDQGLKVSEISSKMRVTSPTISQFINGLESKGLVERIMDQNDRRAVRVRLTAEGEGVVHQAHEAFKANFRGLVAYLGEEDSDQLARLLTKVYEYTNKTEINLNSSETK
ncbi:MarR family winged helix-turn-helix transcriptional regulator [Paenibacillus sp. GCM10028914]|uniref:MarR family winged helix-turn-helix transcriptional regulator n=1 Tax=Paenibacillus sp. GCM10028914 TaxID=3273416 RepID=UPI0036130A98